jgi:cytochrome c
MTLTPLICDVTAYMNTKECPGMANLEQEYSELRNKPVDSPSPLMPTFQGGAASSGPLCADSCAL